VILCYLMILLNYSVIYHQMTTKVYHEWLADNDLEKDSHLLIFFLFILIYFHTSHLRKYHGNGKGHVQYASSSNLQLV